MNSKLAVQMYTIRDFTKTPEDLAKSLKKCADIGYRAVQVSAVGALNEGLVSAAELKRMLDDNGLKCIATHRGWNDFQNNIDKEIQVHKDLGCDFAAVGSIPGDKYSLDLAGFRKWAEEAVSVTKQLKAEGIQFGYHNHAHEFFRPEINGPRLIDVLIDEGGEDLMMELDLFWIWHGGASPNEIMKRCKGRIPVIHLKDKAFYTAEDNPNGIAPIGEGNMPWKEIIPVAEECGVEWYGIEHDVCPRDPFDCLAASYKYLTEMSL